MRSRCPLFRARRGLSLLLCGTGLLLFPASGRTAGIDLNGNGMSDIWEMVFGASGAVPGADVTSTGMTNLQKSVAGLNPFDPKSVLRVSALGFATDGSATLRWPSVAGKSYQVQVCTSLAAANWLPLGGTFAGTGGEITATFGPPAAGVTTRFFRVTVADLDSDGDGVSDWEELQLGYNPNNRFTPGHGTDTNGNPLDDLTTIRAALQATGNTVSLTAADPYISLEGNGTDAGAVLVTRSGRLDALTVTYTVGGTAAPGTDFQSLSGTVTLPVGVNQMLIPVRPSATATPGPTPKTIVLSLTIGANYTPAATPANSATVTLGAKAVAGQVLQEVWLNVPGYGYLSDIPFTSPPNTSRVFTKLDMPQSNPDVNNFGTRIRGFIVPPATGNYTFWISSDDAGEFWLSTDDQPANKTRRAWVKHWTNYKQWNKAATTTDPEYQELNQKSALLALTAGQKYYFEVLQREGGGGDHVEIGWLKPADPAAALPSEIVPGTVGTGANLQNVLLPYTPPVVTPDGSTLYFANLTHQGAALSNGSGSATLRVSADERFAVLTLNYVNLTGPVISEHIHGPADPGQSAGIIFDIDTTPRQSDGTWVWNIGPSGNLTAADLVAAVKSGHTYVNVHTAQYPNGEIRGQFTRTAGATANFTPPPAPPAWTDDHADANAASRFLIQSTFGPSPETIAQVQRDGYAAFLDAQFAVPPTFLLPHLDAHEAATPGTYYQHFRESWWTAAVKGPDQLRQRVAFALSELAVVSAVGVDDAFGLGSYYDMLVTDSFGNFRQLLEDVTLHPTMGEYLNMRGNDKPDPSRGLLPNENYAREVLQLFSIGLNRLNPDGTILLGNGNQPVPTYFQATITNLARVFTGWHYAQNGAQNWPYVARNLRQPMELVAAHHDADPKTVLDGVALPAGQSARQDLKDTLDVIFNHPNVGPFVARQLIQRLVTSNPSPAYVYRVAKVFADNGQGVRGDLRATVRALLLDYEARNPVSPTLGGDASFGHQREPVIRFANLLRAFRGNAVNGGFISPPWDPDDLGQQPLDAPTVFNFFEPGFAQPGAIATAGLTSPEFQITGDTQVIRSANYLRNTIYRTPSATYDPNGEYIVLNPTTDQLALADTPALLVDNLNTLLMSGQMSATMKTTVVNNVTAITNSNLDAKRKARVSQAIYLIVTSPEFSIQK